MSDDDNMTADDVEVWCHPALWLTGPGFRSEPIVRKVGLSFRGNDDSRMFSPKEAIKLAATIRRMARNAQGGSS